MSDRLPKPLRAAWAFVSELLAAGSRHDLGLFAPAIAYALVLSLAPLTLALNLFAPNIVATVEVFQGSPLANQQLEPQQLYGKIAEVAGPLAPILIIGFVVWGASTLFVHVGHAIVRIWEQGPAPGGIRTFIRRHVLAVMLLGAAASALFASSVIGNALANLGALIADAETRLGVSLSWIEVMLSSRLAVDFVFSALLFLVAFTVVPRIRPRVRDILPGALITAGAYAVGQAVLAYYLTASPRFGALGTYGALLGFLVWALYSSTIVLWGAELTHEIAKRRALARGGVDTAPYEYAERREERP